jgi:hypothetical protein
MEKFFNEFEVRYVPRLDNCDSDHLVWIASSRAPTPLDVIIEKLTKPSVRPAEESIDVAKPDQMVIDESDQGLAYDWMSPIKMFLDNQPPSDDNAEIDDEVCLQRRRHSVATRYSWRCMRITLIMALYHRQSLQARFLLAHN